MDRIKFLLFVEDAMGRPLYKEGWPLAMPVLPRIDETIEGGGWRIRVLQVVHQTADGGIRVIGVAIGELV